MIKLTFTYIIFSFSFLIISCNHQQSKNDEEHITYGKSIMLADESLFPIIDDEYQVFANNYKQAEIDIKYKPIKEILPIFLNDSINVAIIPRLLTKEESKYFVDKNIKIRSTKFAIEGIALITHSSNQDSVISVEELIKMLNGNSNSNKTLVFDNQKSSTVEYLMDLANVKVLPKNVYALETNKEVIKYINQHINSIGVVSLTWIKRPTPDFIDEVAKLKIMGVSENNGEFCKPTQSNLKMGKYPLKRDLYIINCQGRAGLGTGFAAFLAGEVGQRIILKSGLAPDSLPSRQIRIRN